MGWRNHLNRKESCERSTADEFEKCDCSGVSHLPHAGDHGLPVGAKAHGECQIEAVHGREASD